MDVPWEHGAKPPFRRGQAWTQGQSSCPNALASKILKKIPQKNSSGGCNDLTEISHHTSLLLLFALHSALLYSLQWTSKIFLSNCCEVFFFFCVFFLFFPLGDMFIRKISETSGAACASNSFSKCIMSQE